MSTTWTGLLKPKRKSELIDISRALGHSDASQENTKDELEAQIVDTLASDKRLREDERFSGLWRPSMAQISEKHEMREKAVAKVGRAIETVETEADRAVAVVDKQAREVARNIEKSKAFGSLTTYTKNFRTNYQATAAEAQHEISDPWRIVALTVWVELLFVLLTHTHYHQKISLGPVKWSPFPLFGQKAYSLTLPNATIWLSAAFLKPFFLWILATVVIPLLFAQFIVFPRPEPQYRRGKRRFSTLEPASAVTFSITRLAVSYFLLKIAPIGIASDWRYIAQFSDVQLLAATVGLGFSLYEALVV